MQTPYPYSVIMEMLRKGLSGVGNANVGAPEPGQAPAPQRPGLFGSVMGGVDKLLGGAAAAELPPNLREDARRQGLLSAGASLLQASGPSTRRTSLGQALGQGLAAGTRGYQEGIGAAQDSLAQQRRMELFSKLGIEANEPVELIYGKLQQGMMAALQSGDVEAARSISEVLKSMAGMVNPERSKADRRVVNGRLVEISPDGTVRELYSAPNAPRPAETRMERAARFQQERAIANDYMDQTKQARVAYNAISGAIRDKDKALQGDPAAIVQLLYSFVKGMDPTSVVREGELALVQSAATYRQQAEAWLRVAQTGGDVSKLVSPDAVRQFVGLLERRGRDMEESILWAQQNAKQYAEDYGLKFRDPSNFRAKLTLPSASGSGNAQAVRDALGTK